MNKPPRKNASRPSTRIRAKWQQHITAQQASGLTQAAYCREHGLNQKYLSLWKSKLAKLEMIAPAAVAAAEKTKLIPVIVKPSAPAMPVSAVPPNELLIKAKLPNGIALEFVFHVAQSLSPLLAELAQLRC